MSAAARRIFLLEEILRTMHEMGDCVPARPRITEFRQDEGSAAALTRAPRRAAVRPPER